jgi:hypothetical protein
MCWPNPLVRLGVLEAITKVLKDATPAILGRPLDPIVA